MVSVFVLSFMVAIAEPGDAVSMPSEVKVLGDHGRALVRAGQTEAGVRELERAYAAMPDPLAFRAARAEILAELRGALLRAHTITRRPDHLCRLRDILRWHRMALLAALGPEGRGIDVADTDDAIREVDGLLGSQSCTDERTVRSPAPAATRSAARGGGSAAGGLLIGAGVASLGVMSFGIVTHVEDRRQLRQLNAEASQRPATETEQVEARHLHEMARERRDLAIGTGIAGGVLVIVGAALQVAGRRQLRALARVPLAVGPGYVGLALRGTF